MAGLLAGSDPWRISADERTKHDEQFMRLKPVGGFVTGEQAKGFFLQSQLPPAVLGQIWALADTNADGKMDNNEFSIAMKLIQMKLKGFEVPKALPPSLKIMPMQHIGIMPSVGMMPMNLPGTPMPGTIPGPGIVPVGIGSVIAPAAVPPVAPGFVRPASPIDIKTERSGSITSQDSPTGSVNSPLQEWAVPHTSKLKYTQLFNTYDRTRSGFITGAQARNILVQTGLPQNMLAQIWSLSDIDGDGKLTCEEFCLAFHLVDCVRAGDKLPTTLTPELIPPSYRRIRSSSIQGGIALNGISTVTPGGPTTGMMGDLLSGLDLKEDDKQKITPATFEDKRRENFEKGQAELERRRQALLESQRREQEERERKDREEQERKERIRQEQERRRQMELEKQLAKQRELEQEKEEQRRKAMEQREAARREMERQRQLEWEKQRRQEMMSQRQKEQEKVLQLKGKNQSLTIELEQLNEKIRTLNEKLAEARNGVNNLKSEIDTMRATRDQKISEMDKVKAELKNQNQRLLKLSQERAILQNQMKSNLTNNPIVESFGIVMHSFNNKQITLSQLKEKLSNLEKETSQKLQDIDNNNGQLKDLKQQLSDLAKEGEKIYEVYLTKRQQVIDLRKEKGFDSEVQKPAEIEPSKEAWNNQTWGDSAPLESTWPQNDDNWAAKENSAAWPPTEGDAWASNDKWDTTDNKEAAEWGKAEDDSWPTNNETPKPTEEKWDNTTTEKQPEDGLTGRMIRYRVLYGFDARNSDELSIMPGDVILVPEGLAHEPGWLGGELHGKTGWFPEAYVEKIEPVEEDEFAENAEVSSPSLTGVQETVHIVGTEMKMTLSGIQEAPENASDNGSVSEVATQENQTSAFIQVPKSVLGTASPIPGQGTSVEGLQAQALFPWRAKKENHLTFNKGDVITVREQQDMWWYGELEGKLGWFPKSYVKLIAGPRKQGDELKDDVEDGADEEVLEAVTPVTEYYEALYAYQSSEQGDLSFNQGDIIMVVKKEGDWWTGIIGDRNGVFPSNYVKKADNQVTEELPNAPELEDTTFNEEVVEEINKTEAVQEVLREMPDVVPQTTKEELSQPSESQDEIKTETLDVKREAPEAPKSPKSKSGKKPEIALVIAPYTATGPEQLSLQRGQLLQIRKKSPNGWWEGELQAKGKKRQIGWFPASYVKLLASSARNTPEIGQELVISMYPYEAKNEDELTFQKGEIITIISKDDSAWWKGELHGNVGLFPANYVQATNAGQNADTTASSQWLQTLMALSPTERKRQESIRELISTEQTYMDDMSIVLDAFYRPLKEAKVCNHQELEAIFVNWKELIACNIKLLKAFRVRKKMSRESIIPVIGDILCENLPHLTPYIRFCSCQLNAAALIQKKTENVPEFKEVAKRCCQDVRTKGMPLSSFLLKPMQRITKYPLLIKKILESTPSDHPDHAQLEDALFRAEELCNQINEGVREKENSDKLEWIQQHIHCDGLVEKITFNSLTNSLGPRKFLHSGTLLKAKSNKELVAFLFNDFLLLTQPQKLLGSVSSLLNFDKTSTVQFRMYKQPIFLNEIMVKAQDPEEDTHFQINHIDRTYSLKCNTSSERNVWVKKLEEASRSYIETERKKRERAHSLRAQRTAGVGRLLVVVMEGINLKAKLNGQCDPYCEVSMGSQEHRTKVIPDTTNPKWNASMQFVIKDLNQDVLCITVFDRDYFSPNDFLGRTEIRIADILQESKQTKGPIVKQLFLYEVEFGEVIVKLDLHLFETVN